MEDSRYNSRPIHNHPEEAFLLFYSILSGTAECVWYVVFQDQVCYINTGQVHIHQK
jgi:hypothetical protein